jgi:inner membrane protein
MDNITHTLAGVALAEAARHAYRARTDREPTPGFARLAYVVSALANNLPDADVLFTWVTPGKLGSLLHHRGHTHALPIGLSLGAALVAIAFAIARRRGPALGPGEAAWVWGLGLLGPVTHVSMDGWNVYGVHPFWPFYNGWFYGDSIFIVEPLLWAAVVPPLWFAARAAWWRAALALVLCAALVLPWLLPDLIPLPQRLAIAAVAALGLAFARVAAPPARAATAMLAGAAVVVGFYVVSGLVRTELERRLSFEPSTLHDLAISPLPADPLCWTMASVQTNAAGEIVLRRGTFAPFPALFRAHQCPPQADRITAPLAPIAARSDEAMRWEGEFRAPLARLRALARESCQAAAMLRFLRVPFWAEGPGGIVIGDLRFDRNDQVGFAEMPLPPVGTPCPSLIPPWLPPRRDMLGLTP